MHSEPVIAPTVARQCRAAPAKQETLNQQHSAKRALTCAECGADRQFAFAPNSTRQDEIRDIGTCNDEQQG